MKLIFNKSAEDLFLEFRASRKDSDYDKFIKKIENHLKAKIFAKVKDEDATDELFQESITKFHTYEQLDIYDPKKSKIVDWIYAKITIGYIMHHFRDSQKYNMVDIDDAIMQDSDEAVIDINLIESENPETKITNREFSKILQKSIFKLERDYYQNVILLRYFGDMTLRTIAQIVRTPEGTVRAWHSRAIDSLRILIHNKI